MRHKRIYVYDLTIQENERRKEETETARILDELI